MESSVYLVKARLNNANELCNLPDVVFARIMEYLKSKDALNLRLTCYDLYNLSNCREYFKKFKVKVGELDTERLKSLQYLLENYGIYLSLNLVHVQEFYWSSPLKYFTNIENVQVSDWQLDDVCQNCIITF